MFNCINFMNFFSCCKKFAAFRSEFKFLTTKLKMLLGLTEYSNAVNVNVNVVYSCQALSFEIASSGMPLKHRKQITLNEHNMVKNPNWLEADQLAIYKA